MIRYILIVRCAMEKSTLVINKITYNLTDSLPFYAIILLIFILFVCLIQRRFATLIRSYSDWSHHTCVFKSPIQLLDTLATDYTTLNTLITCVSNMEVMMVWRRPELYFQKETHTILNRYSLVHYADMGLVILRVLYHNMFTKLNFF